MKKIDIIRKERERMVQQQAERYANLLRFVTTIRKGKSKPQSNSNGSTESPSKVMNDWIRKSRGMIIVEEKDETDEA